MERKLNLPFLIAALVGLISLPVAGQHPPRPSDLPLGKVTVDDYWHFHNVGNLGLTVTNYGVLGQGYLVALKDQPSCQYKLHSRL
ncbi:MAG: hypothetical protein ACPL3S_04935, partial [Halothiobacillaceae bacterium]